MKSSELIRLLQEEDPSGEVEVCVNNVDIYTLHTEPAFWDGYLQVLSRDHSKDPYYNLTGGKYVSRGKKIVICPVSINDVVRDHPDTAVVDYSEVTPTWIERMKDHDEKIRQSARDLELEIDKGHFVEWAKKKARAIHPNGDMDEVKEVAESYYDGHFSPKDPLKKMEPTKGSDGHMWGHSIVDRRESHWNDVAQLKFDGWWSIAEIEGQTTEV